MQADRDVTQIMSEYLAEADHLDEKAVWSEAGLRDFVAAVFSYRPAWMRLLWRIRGRVARWLGIPHDESNHTGLDAAHLPTSPGETALFLTVLGSDGERYWAAVCQERHLDFAVCVWSEASEDAEGQRFRLLTAVRYNNRIGRLYFNLIRPFHHLVVSASMHHAAQAGRS